MAHKLSLMLKAVLYIVPSPYCEYCLIDTFLGLSLVTLNPGSATQGVPGRVYSVAGVFEQTLHCVQGDSLCYKRKS